MKFFLSRRQALRSLLAGPALVQAAVPTLQPASDVSHRLSISTYPFRELIAVPGRTPKPKATLNLEQFGRSIVREFGVFGIEPWSPHFASLQPAYLSSLRKSFDSAGLRVVNIPCDASVKPCGTAAESAAALDTWSQWVDVAVVLGSPSIRVHVPPTTANELTCATTSLGALAEYGESKNIVINLENDDPKNESAGQVIRVIQAVNSPYLRALPDFCNSMLIKNDRADNLRGLAALFPHAWNICHVKDVEVADGVELHVDVDPIFAIAKQAGYKGFFSMESETPGDPYVSTKQLIAAARKNLA